MQGGHLSKEVNACKNYRREGTELEPRFHPPEAMVSPTVATPTATIANPVRQRRCRKSHPTGVPLRNSNPTATVFETGAPARQLEENRETE